MLAMLVSSTIASHALATSWQDYSIINMDVLPDRWIDIPWLSPYDRISGAVQCVRWYWM